MYLRDRVGEFDRMRLEVASLALRESDLNLSTILPLKHSDFVDKTLETVSLKICTAKNKGSAVVLMMGAHVLRSGVQRYLIDLMEKGCLTCIAMNGAGVIHDFEFALLGAT